MRACVCCICTCGTRPARTAAPTNGCRCVTTSRRPSQEGSAAARRAAVCLRDMAADTAGQQQLFHSDTSCFRFTPSSFIVAGALLTFPIFIFFNNSPKSKSRTLSGFQFSVDSPHTLTHDEPRSDLFMAGMKRAPPLLCCRDIVNFFCDVCRRISCLFATVLFTASNPSIFPSNWMLFGCHQKELICGSSSVFERELKFGIKN